MESVASNSNEMPRDLSLLIREERAKLNKMVMAFKTITWWMQGIPGKSGSVHWYVYVEKKCMNVWLKTSKNPIMMPKKLSQGDGMERGCSSGSRNLIIRGVTSLVGAGGGGQEKQSYLG